MKLFRRFSEKDKFLWLLLAVIAVAGILRFFAISQTAKFFYDEATHLGAGLDIFRFERIVWLGPAFLDKAGQTAFLPPLYYYLVALGLLITAGHPLGPYLLTALAGTIGVGAMYWFSLQLFPSKKRQALLVAFLWAVNYNLVSVERNIWNPNFIPVLSAVYFGLFYQALKGKRKFLPFAGLVLGMMVSLHASSALLVVISLALLAIYRPKFHSIKVWLLGAGGFLLPFLPWLAWEARHGFPNTRSAYFILWRYQDPSLFHGTLGESLARSQARFVSAFQNFISQHRFDNLILLALALLLALGLFKALASGNKKANPYSYLIIFILGFILLASQFRFVIWSYYWLAIWAPLVVLIGEGLDALARNKLAVLTILLVSVYLFGQIFFWQENIALRLNRFNRQELSSYDIVLADQIRAIDWVVSDANGSKFNIDFKEKYFYPGFRNRIAYKYLLRWRRAKVDPQAQTIYFVVQPRNFPKAHQDIGKILKEREFGGIKIIKARKNETIGDNSHL